jgi:hypothetical protein
LTEVFSGAVMPTLPVLACESRSSIGFKYLRASVACLYQFKALLILVAVSAGFTKLAASLRA